MALGPTEPQLAGSLVQLLRPDSGTLAQYVAQITHGGPELPSRRQVILKIRKRFLKDVETRIQFSESVGPASHLLWIQRLL